MFLFVIGDDMASSLRIGGSEIVVAGFHILQGLFLYDDDSVYWVGFESILLGQMKANIEMFLVVS